MTRYAALDRYIEAQMPAWTGELVEFCRFRSERGDVARLTARFLDEFAALS